MIEVSSYCCVAEDRPLPSAKTISPWLVAVRFFGFGIGVMKSALRRASTIFCVG